MTTRFNVFTQFIIKNKSNFNYEANDYGRAGVVVEEPGIDVKKEPETNGR